MRKSQPAFPVTLSKLQLVSANLGAEVSADRRERCCGSRWIPPWRSDPQSRMPRMLSSCWFCGASAFGRFGLGVGSSPSGLVSFSTGRSASRARNVCPVSNVTRVIGFPANGPAASALSMISSSLTGSRTCPAGHTGSPCRRRRGRRILRLAPPRACVAWGRRYVPGPRACRRRAIV